MKDYRKRPVVVQAIENTKDNCKKVLEFIGLEAHFPYVERYQERDPYWLNVSTLEGEVKAYEGEMIVKGTAGEFYPVKPDIFAETFESAETEPEKKSEGPTKDPILVCVNCGEDPLNKVPQKE